MVAGVEYIARPDDVILRLPRQVGQQDPQTPQFVRQAKRRVRQLIERRRRLAPEGVIIKRDELLVRRARCQQRARQFLRIATQPGMALHAGGEIKADTR